MLSQGDLKTYEEKKNKQQKTQGRPDETWLSRTVLQLPDHSPIPH